MIKQINNFLDKRRTANEIYSGRSFPLGKKAAFSLSMEYVIGLLLLLIFLFYGTLLIMKVYGPSMQAKTMDLSCLISVRENSANRMPGISVENVKVNCPTNYVTFHADNYEQDYDVPEGGLSKFNPYSTENKPIDYKKDTTQCKSIKDKKEQEECVFSSINKKISEEMVRCWFVFSEGRLRVFSQYETGSQCVVCTNILFGNDLKEKYPDIGFPGADNPQDPNYDLTYYMKTVPFNSLLPKDLKSEEESDSAEDKGKVVLSAYDFTKDVLDSNWEDPVYDYQLSDDYAIVFSALNENFVRDVMGDMFNQFKNWATKSEKYQNEPNYINTLNFIPNEEVPVYCKTWA